MKLVQEPRVHLLLIQTYISEFLNHFFLSHLGSCMHVTGKNVSTYQDVIETEHKQIINYTPAIP